MMALKLSLALAKAIGAHDIHENLMYIWENTHRKVQLPFSWIWAQYARLRGMGLSETVYLESEELLDKSISVAEIVLIVDDIDRMVLEMVHDMTQRAKIDIDISSIPLNQEQMI